MKQGLLFQAGRGALVAVSFAMAAWAMAESGNMGDTASSDTATDEPGTIPAARPGPVAPRGAQGPIRMELRNAIDYDYYASRFSGRLDTSNGLWETQPGNRVVAPAMQAPAQ